MLARLTGTRTRRNPVPPSKFVQARELGRAFSGSTPELRETLDASKALGLPVRGGHPLFVFGELLEVKYRTTRDGEVQLYKHPFRVQSRPLLAARHDGKRIYIVGGRYRFTETGINDE
jgi:hypothetical protein